jgi:hypothetical protein
MQRQGFVPIHKEHPKPQQQGSLLPRSENHPSEKTDQG